MKKIVIATLCFISLINAADDNKEITFNMGKKTYRGYSLTKDKYKLYSSIAVHRMNDANEGISIISQHRNNAKIAIQCTLQDHSESTYEITGGILQREHFDLRDGNIRSEALSLCKQYIVAHLLKSKSYPEYENHEVTVDKMGYHYSHTFSENECKLYSSIALYFWDDSCQSIGIIAQHRSYEEVKAKCWLRDTGRSTYGMTGVLKYEEYFKLNKGNRRNKLLFLCKEYIRAHAEYIRAHADLHNSSDSKKE